MFKKSVEVLFGLILCVFALTVTGPSFAFGGQEKPKAKCGDLILIQVDTSTMSGSNEHSQNNRYQVDYRGERLYVDVTELNDIIAYQFVLDDVGQSITSSSEPMGSDLHRETIYRYQGSMCQSL